MCSAIFQILLLRLLLLLPSRSGRGCGERGDTFTAYYGLSISTGGKVEQRRTYWGGIANSLAQTRDSLTQDEQPSRQPTYALLQPPRGICITVTSHHNLRPLASTSRSPKDWSNLACGERTPPRGWRRKVLGIIGTPRLCLASSLARTLRPPMPWCGGGVVPAPSTAPVAGAPSSWEGRRGALKATRTLQRGSESSLGVGGKNSSTTPPSPSLGIASTTTLSTTPLELGR